MQYNMFIVIGVLLNVALVIIDRFVVKIPDKLEIALCVVGVVLILIGLVLLRGGNYV